MSAEFITDPSLDLPGIRHGFFTRKGGVSTGIYESLNCGIGSKDDRAAVLENRARLMAALGLPADQLVTLYQVHSPTVVTVTAPFEGTPPDADGMVTTTHGLALGALSADCAPLLFADPDAGVVGAAHAGWRGALAGVGDETVMAMERLGARRSAIRAVVGPCISLDSYEVRADFAGIFMDADPANGRFFRSSPKPGHAHFDLPGYLVERLSAFGVGSVNATGHCTYKDAGLFFSYRRTTHRGEPDYGRQVSAICLTGEEGSGHGASFRTG